MLPPPKVKFFTAVKNCCMNYVNFEGRTRRSEFWYFMLVINTLTILLLILLILCSTGVIRSTTTYYIDEYNKRVSVTRNSNTAMIIIFIVYIFGITLPTLGATVRRLHDMGRQGETIFIGLVPFFGGIILLILLCRDSIEEKNEYGYSPKYASPEDYEDDAYEAEDIFSIN